MLFMLYKKEFLSLSIFLMLLTTLRAQEAIPAAGGNASGNGGTVSYSVGQLVYTTNTGSTGTVAQGVQQPYEISVLTEVKEAKGIQLQCSVYPNPTTDYLTLKIDNYSPKEITYQLFDITGKLMDSGQIQDVETIIIMRDHVTATYFLKVTQNGKELKTFKIIKH
jgi:hypothetical protein